MKAELKVGDTLSEVFSIYRGHAGVLIPVAFWLFLVIAILDGVAGDNLSLVSLSFLVSIVIATLYKGMVVSLVRDVQDGRDSSYGELISAATPVLAPLLGAGVLAALGIGLGLLALLVPGLFLLTIWALIAPVIVIERLGVIAAFRRSRELVRGYGWPVFGAILTAYLLIIIGALVFGGIAESIAGGPFLRIVFGALAATITAPIEALVAAVLYYRLVAIKAPAAVDPALAAAPPVNGEGTGTGTGP